MRKLLLNCCLCVSLSVVFSSLPAECRAAQNVDLRGAAKPADAVWLDDLDLKPIEQNWRGAKANTSIDSNDLKLGGEIYRHGVGAHASSYWLIRLGGDATGFLAAVGVDDETKGKGSVTFEIWTDGKKVFESGRLKGGDKPKNVAVELTGAKEMELIVTDAGDGISNDHADWAGGLILLKPGAAKPVSVLPPQAPPPILAEGDSTRLGIHGPRITGGSPGRPFLFLVPATGEKPLAFSAKNLPEGVKIDPTTGVISGSLTSAGTTKAEITVKNSQGTSTRSLMIVGRQNALALTPPMGWNSWNCWAGAVDDAKVRAAADVMVSSGLASYGYQYVNIDDCWQGKRDAQGAIVPNKKFPDMKALGDYIHSKGLKFGIYSSPGPKTCAGFEGSYRHEVDDAKIYAAWGVDYLKYDWCSYTEIEPKPDHEALVKPYEIMRKALRETDRDILYSLCQYGWGNVWEWGADVDGNCWRTTGDITDTWDSMSKIGFGQAGHEKYAGPGRWNDPDMLVVGKVGWGPSLHATNLKPHEQVTHITLWSLLAAPMLIGCDMTAFDKFTLSLLTNDEVIDVNQDPLGKQASRIVKQGDVEIWARPLFDGTTAVGLFNLSRRATKISLKWSDLKLDGKQPIRDLWQKKDLGEFADGFETSVQPHGAAFLKVGRPKE